MGWLCCVVVLLFWSFFLESLSHHVCSLWSSTYFVCKFSEPNNIAKFIRFEYRAEILCGSLALEVISFSSAVAVEHQERTSLRALNQFIRLSSSQHLNCCGAYDLDSCTSLAKCMRPLDMSCYPAGLVVSPVQEHGLSTSDYYLGLGVWRCTNPRSLHTLVGIF